VHQRQSPPRPRWRSEGAGEGVQELDCRGWQVHHDVVKAARHYSRIQPGRAASEGADERARILHEAARFRVSHRTCNRQAHVLRTMLYAVTRCSTCPISAVSFHGDEQLKSAPC